MTLLWAPPEHRHYLSSLGMALVCALVLALARWCFPPTPRRRLFGALMVCAAIALSNGGSSVPELRLSAMGAFEARAPEAWDALAAFGEVMGRGVLLGWLILTVIEGRSLAEMGWTRRRLGRYVLLGLGLGIVCSMNALITVPVSAGHPMGRWEFVEAVAGTPANYLLPQVARALLVGWYEENVFRGHLLPALSEAGCSALWANLIQSGIFALYHMRWDVLGWRRSHYAMTLRDRIARGQLWRFGWGVLFGFLRLRCRSIVPGFVCHATVDSFGIALGDVQRAYYNWWATWRREL